jgi:hypothetical protein
MNPEPRLIRLMRLHYKLMNRKNFWYSKVNMERSKRLCLAASDLRKAIKEATVE